MVSFGSRSDLAMICPRCGARFADSASECAACGLPAVLTGSANGDTRIAVDHRVLEPEVLESLDEAARARFTPPLRHVGCSLGPGCGCIGLPLALLAGIVVSSAIALLWVLSLGRLPSSLIRLAARARRGFSRS